MVDLDFTPLYRSTIGFDRVPRLMKSAMRMSDADLGYPPYNIEKAGDDSYRIVIALAGLAKTMSKSSPSKASSLFGARWLSAKAPSIFIMVSQGDLSSAISLLPNILKSAAQSSTMVC